MNERIGIIQFILLLIGMNLTFMPMHFLGVEGMPRRIYTYGAEQGWTYWNQVTTIGAYIQAVSFALFAYNLFDALRKPKNAPADPWNARTLEWSISSPPPEFNFYKNPEVKQIDDFWYKKQKIKDKAIEKLKGNEHVHLPNSSWYPILLAASVLFLPIGLLIYSATDSTAHSVLLIPTIGFLATIYFGFKWAFEPAE